MAGWAYSKVAHVSSGYDKGAWAWWSGKGYGWAQLTQTGCMKNAVSCNSPLGLDLALFRSELLVSLVILFVERVRGEVGIYGLNPETDWVFLYYFSHRAYQNVLCRPWIY